MAERTQTRTTATPASARPEPGLLASIRSFAPAGTAFLQRKCACGGSAGLAGGCEECRKKKMTGSGSGTLQRKSLLADAHDGGHEPGEVPPLVYDVLRSPGQPLDERSRAFFEPIFGRSFNEVRVHSDAPAAASAEAVAASAFTVGNRIAFGSGQYAPDSPAGRELLAHELTHVVQQAAMPSFSGRALTLDSPCNRAEREADHSAAQVTAGRVGIAAVSSLAQPVLQRKPKGKAKKSPPKPPAAKKPDKPPATPTGCKNQKKVDEVLEAAKKKYGAGVEIIIHTIASKENLWKLASATVKDNTVTDTGDLNKELEALNKPLGSGTIGNCVLLLKGWTSPAAIAAKKRTDCSERIEVFKKSKGPGAKFSKWEQEKVAKKDTEYKTIVERVKKREPGLFTGRIGEYSKFVKELNDPWIGALNEGECVALPVNWMDPNIGVLPAKPDKKALTAESIRAIATVAAEQTLAKGNAPEQQKFIWFAIRKRVETEVRGPNLTAVLTAGEFNAIGTSDFKAAVEDLKNDPPTRGNVVNARNLVLDNWDVSLPKEAGAFYFHWREGSTPEKCYGKPKKANRERKEKECAWNWANAQDFAGSVTKANGWHHMIRGNSPEPDERIGSMYIYP